MNQTVAYLSVDETWRGCIRCPWEYRGVNAQAALMAHLASDHPNWQSEDLPAPVAPPVPPTGCAECGSPWLGGHKTGCSRLSGDGPISPVSPTTPEWGKPELHLLSWSIIAPCGCGISEISGGTLVGGDHCSAHTFADLVSGERILREAQTP